LDTLIRAATSVADALDKPASKVKYIWPGVEDGRVMRIVQFVFNPKIFKDQWIFNIPERTTSSSTDFLSGA